MKYTKLLSSLTVTILAMSMATLFTACEKPEVDPADTAKSKKMYVVGGFGNVIVAGKKRKIEVIMTSGRLRMVKTG